MQIFTIIEVTDIDVTSVQTFRDADKANKTFERMADGVADIIDSANWGHDNPDTLRRFAGDDAYSLELHATEV